MPFIHTYATRNKHVSHSHSLKNNLQNSMHYFFYLLNNRKDWGMYSPPHTLGRYHSLQTQFLTSLLKASIFLQMISTSGSWLVLRTHSIFTILPHVFKYTTLQYYITQWKADLLRGGQCGRLAQDINMSRNSRAFVSCCKLHCT